MQEPAVIREEIIAAALERHREQTKLLAAAGKGTLSHFMRVRQRAVDQADRKIAEAAARLSAFVDGQ